MNSATIRKDERTKTTISEEEGKAISKEAVLCLINKERRKLKIWLDAVESFPERFEEFAEIARKEVDMPPSGTPAQLRYRLSKLRKIENTVHNRGVCPDSIAFFVWPTTQQMKERFAGEDGNRKAAMHFVRMTNRLFRDTSAAKAIHILTGARA